MKSFLANLAAKTLNRAPVVKPRLASIFEPTALVLSASAFASVEELIEPERPPETAVRPVAESAVRQQLAGPALERLIVHERMGIAPSAPVLSFASAEPQRSRTEPSPPPAERITTREVERVEVVHQARGLTLEPRRESPSAQQGVKIERKLHEVVRQESAPAPRTTERKQPTAEAAPPPRALEPARPAMHSVRTVQTAPQPRRVIVAAPVETAPEVHITIGRIEVRALTTSTPAKAPEQRVPQLSLADYLAQRDRGRR
jgi:hypothetical protein